MAIILFLFVTLQVAHTVLILRVIAFEVFLVALAICFSKTLFFSSLAMQTPSQSVSMGKGGKAIALVVAALLLAIITVCPNSFSI